MMNDQGSERIARAALEAQYGRPLSDEEWNTAKERLLRYVRMLRDWDRAKDDHHGSD